MREEFLSYLKCFIGSRYQWAAEGPYNVGFDCSGLVLEGLRSVGMWGKDDATAQNIFERFKDKGVAMSGISGALVFFGKDRSSITHVGVMINNNQYIEAGGGDSKTVDKGMVRIRLINWRKDMVGIIPIF